MKCLILGYGYMGKIRLGQLKERPDVTAIRIYDPGIREEEASEIREFLLPHAEQIPWNQFNAVFVCTPNNVTARFCVEAIRHCGHVFCEKPPGTGWKDFESIAEAAIDRPGHVLVFGFNHRLHPSVKAARALVGEGGVGEILYVKGTYGKSGGKHYRDSWRNKKEISGGGILLDQGIHMLDLFCLFLGELQVMGHLLKDLFWHCGVEDNAFVLLKSKQGIPAFLHSSATLWKHTFHLEIGCRDGYLVASGLLSKTGSYGREQLIIGRRQFEDEALALGNPREEIIYFDRDESWKQEVDEFLTAIKEGRPANHGTLEDSRRVMALIRDIYT